jgi:acyl carrier protein
MDRPGIYEILTDIFRDIFDDPGIEVHPALSSRDLEVWDSFNHINMMVATEMAFGVKFKASEVEGLKNVGELVNLIETKLALQPG